MSLRSDALDKALSRRREITINVTGRTSGRDIAVLVWFVWEAPRMYLLPVSGSDTQWYKNILKNPSLRVKLGGAETELHGVPVTEPAEVASVVEKFRAKYGDGGISLYSRLDVAVVAQTPAPVGPTRSR
jgi:hypothetical protein